MKVNNRRHAKMSRKASAILALCVVLVLTIAVGYLGVHGTWLDSRGLYKLLPWLPTTDVDNWPQSIALGLDLKGGVYVEYEATMSDELREEGNNFDYLLQNTMDIIAKRLTEKGYPEATVSKVGVSGIRVEIPDVTDPAAVLDLIGSPAKLEFLDSDGNVFMDGSALQTAYATKDENSKPAISFTLTKEGANIFGDMTAKAQNYALQLQSGALPLDLRQDKLDTISATLGVDALGTSVKAAIIGILLVMLIMLVRYRLAGLVADWALCIYIILLFLFIAVVPGIQLTLPGIAGVILGIGMAVDANVVIFERVKEEVRAGRPTIHAVRIGFKHAMSAVVDANITTIIAAVVLLFFGTGSVQGFATTLLLGVIASMLTAILITRFLLTRVARIWSNPALYAANVKPAADETVKEAK